LNAKNSWICKKDAITNFHSKCQLGLEVLNLNAYSPNFRKSQTQKIPSRYVQNFWLCIAPIDSVSIFTIFHNLVKKRGWQMQQNTQNSTYLDKKNLEVP
jgi:hypothetical protein